MVDPPAGLDYWAPADGGALAYATKGFAHVLDLAFVEAKVAPPNVGLTVETLLATPDSSVEADLEADGKCGRAPLGRAHVRWIAHNRPVEAELPEDDR